MQKVKEEKGITLIAIVITIIVLLILVGIAINMLTGDNGILNKAAEAKVKTDKASILEQIKLAVMGSLGVDRKINYDKLKEDLERKGIDVKDNGNGYVITKDDIIQVINKSGEDVAITESSKSSQNGYIVLSDKTETFKNLKIFGNSVQDGTPTEEEPIEIKSVGDLVTDTEDSNYGKYEVDVVVRRKNLLPVSQSLPITVRSITANYNYTDNLYVFNGTGTNAGRTINPNSNIKLKANTTYTLTIEKVSGILNTYRAGAALQIFDKNNNVLRQTDFINDTNKVYKKTVTYTPTEDKVVGIASVWFYSDSNSTTATNLKLKLQIEPGNKSTEYEPYVEPIIKKIYLDEPLRKVGDYADYIDFENKKIVRRVEVIDNTGKLPLEQSLRGLTTPIEETINLPTISVKAGISIVDIETKLTPSNTEVLYYTKK